MDNFSRIARDMKKVYAVPKMAVCSGFVGKYKGSKNPTASND